MRSRDTISVLEEEARAASGGGLGPGEELPPIEDRIRDMESTLTRLRRQATFKSFGMSGRLGILEPPMKLLDYDPVSLYENPRLHNWSWLSESRFRWVKSIVPGFVQQVSIPYNPDLHTRTIPDSIV